MTLSGGTRLGPYEVVSRLGAGGMGEVWRARDARLQRDVAIKVLPAELSSDAGRLKRFENEARAASALNHPNIVTVYDIGFADSVSCIAMELVEGKTLRELLFGGPLPIKRVLGIATQIADGLAKAHEAGIIHRDLKPENVMVTKDGRVKILDFGLAKLTYTGADSGEGTNIPTETGTGAGVVLGTVGYMSPEQASGQPVDFRSDQFSFGSIVYELATGKRAFQKGTAVDTLSAILHEDPMPVGELNPEAPLPLRWIVEQCLAKDPDDRYASTKDLARELARVSTHLADASAASVAPRRTARRRRIILMTALAVAAAVLGALLVLNRSTSRSSAPRYRQVTFGEQVIMNARWAPDGETLVYAASRQGKPSELYMSRVGSVESRSLGISAERISSISPAGQMAFLLGSGTLAEASLGGGAPRELLENVRTADWSPDGKALAVVRTVDGEERLEFPVGKILYQTKVAALILGKSIGSCRISPTGEQIALGGGEGLSLVDRNGKTTQLVAGAGDGEVTNIAWSPRGDEIWFLKFEGGASDLHGISPTGRTRFLASLPGDSVLHDVSRNGRVLLEKGIEQWKVLGRLRGDTAERDLSYLSATVPADLSRDGTRFLFVEKEYGWGNATVYLRPIHGPPVPLGPGLAQSLSPDGKWVAAWPRFRVPEIVLLPTGAGQSRRLPNGNLTSIRAVRWLPDGKRVVFIGSETGEEARIYVQDIAGGLPTPITPERVANHLPAESEAAKSGNLRVSPDGKWVVARNAQRQTLRYPVEPGEARLIPGISPDEGFLQWSSDGRRLFVRKDEDVATSIFLHDIVTGERTLWQRFPHPDSTWGPPWRGGVIVTPDGSSWVRAYSKYSSNLFVLDGAK